MSESFSAWHQEIRFALPVKLVGCLIRLTDVDLKCFRMILGFMLLTLSELLMLGISGKTELAKQVARYMHKDIKKV